MARVHRRRPSRLVELKDGGAIDAGLGVNEAAICRMLDEAPVDVSCWPVATRSSRPCERPALLDRCQGGTSASSPPGPTTPVSWPAEANARGRCADRGRTPEILERLARLEALCAAHDIPLAAAALQFGLGHPAVASVLPGVAGAARVAETSVLATTSIPRPSGPTWLAAILADGVPPLNRHAIRRTIPCSPKPITPPIPT
jgi:D-threo-aldose 1-dehydrogenase